MPKRKVTSSKSLTTKGKIYLPTGTATKMNRQAARSALRGAGITSAYLSKTTGTTKKEGAGIIQNQVQAFLQAGKLGAKTTSATRQALTGGKTGGVPARPARAGRMVRNARKQYRNTRKATRRV